MKRDACVAEYEMGSVCGQRPHAHLHTPGSACINGVPERHHLYVPPPNDAEALGALVIELQAVVKALKRIARQLEKAA